MSKNDSVHSTKSKSIDKKVPLWLWLLGLLTAIGPLTIDMYLPSFPSISADLQVPQSRVELTVSTYLLGLALSQLFYGPIADRYGRKKPLLGGLAIYMLATIGCALASSVEYLLFFRCIQACGAAAAMVIPRAVIRDQLNTRDSAMAMSMMMLIMGVAPILAPLMGGYLSPVTGWRGLFAVMLFYSAIMFVLAIFRLRETMPAEKAVPLHLRTIGRNYAGLLRDRNYMGFSLAGGIGMSGLFAYISVSPTVFINMYGVPQQHFGLFFGLNAFGLIVGSQISARLLRIHSPLGILRTALTCGCLSILIGLGLSLAGMLNLTLLTLTLLGFTTSLGFILPNATALALKDQGHRLGVASALMGCLQFLFGTLSSSIVSSSLDHTAVPLFVGLAICSLLALLCGNALARPTDRSFGG